MLHYESRDLLFLLQFMMVLGVIVVVVKKCFQIINFKTLLFALVSLSTSVEFSSGFYDIVTDKIYVLQ